MANKAGRSTVGTCKQCGHRRCGLSQRGLCPKCGLANQIENTVQMQKKEGVRYDKWKTNIRKAILRA